MFTTNRDTETKVLTYIHSALPAVYAFHIYGVINRYDGVTEQRRIRSGRQVRIPLPIDVAHYGEDDISFTVESLETPAWMGSRELAFTKLLA